jgi:hypothetical protein
MTVDSITFSEILSITDMVTLNVRTFFNLTVREFKTLLSVLILFNNNKFTSITFSKKDIIPIANMLDVTFKDRYKANLLMESLTEKGFFTRVGEAREIPGEDNSRITKYVRNKENLRYFAIMVQVFIYYELKPFKNVSGNKATIPELSLLNKAKKDAVKHMKKIKKIIKKK